MNERRPIVNAILNFFNMKKENGKAVLMKSYEENEQRLLQLLPGKTDLLKPALIKLKELTELHILITNTFDVDSRFQTVKELALLFGNKTGDQVESLKRYIDLLARIDPKDIDTHKTDILQIAESFEFRRQEYIDSVHKVIDEMTEAGMLK